MNPDPRKQPIVDRSKFSRHPAAKPDPQEMWLWSQQAKGTTLQFMFGSGRTVVGKILNIWKFSLSLQREDGSKVLIWKTLLETTEPVQ